MVKLGLVIGIILWGLSSGQREQKGTSVAKQQPYKIKELIIIPPRQPSLRQQGHFPVV